LPLIMTCYPDKRAANTGEPCAIGATYGWGTAVTRARFRSTPDSAAGPRRCLPPAEPGMIPLTIPEIKRLLAALTTQPLPRWLVIHWYAWTRRHQARSRRFHKRTRLARDAEPSLVS